MYSDNSVKTNVDNLSGKHAQVTMAFDAHTNLGRVKIDGDDWRAEMHSDELVNEGDMVKIIRAESNTLIVKPIKSK